MKLKCRFGTPHHGWLPLRLIAGAFELEMDASDVPVNPLDLLVRALRRALSGVESEVWWHLEPASYYFKFEPTEDGNYDFSISFSESNPPSDLRPPVFVTSGNANEIVLPFWRALKEFESHNHVEPAWPIVNKDELAKLTAEIKGELSNR